MRKRYGVILAVIGYIIFFSSMEGWGADWKFIAKDIQGNVFEIDTASISRQSNNIVGVFVKTTYSKKGRNEVVKYLGKAFKDLSYSTRLNEYHCTKKKNRTLGTNWYSLDGGMMYSDKSTPEWEFVVPDSMGGVIFKEVCK
jgi:hypothetical protein